MPSATLGVPASNFQGRSFQVASLSRTRLIMSPPPRNGGIDSSSDRRAQSTPIPVGPHILCPLKAPNHNHPPKKKKKKKKKKTKKKKKKKKKKKCAATATALIGLLVPSLFDWRVMASSSTP